MKGVALLTKALIANLHMLVTCASLHIMNTISNCNHRTFRLTLRILIHIRPAVLRNQVILWINCRLPRQAPMWGLYMADKAKDIDV